MNKLVVTRSYASKRLDNLYPPVEILNCRNIGQTVRGVVFHTRWGSLRLELVRVIR